MDDIAALRQFGLAPLTDVAVFKPANATRGLDRPTITYFLKSQPKAMTIDFLDAKGQVVRSITGQPPRKEGDTGDGGGGGGGGGPQGAPMAAGVNRYTWDLNSTGVVTFPGMILWGATQSGPAVLPGSYQVRLTADGVTQTQSFAVLKHPLRPVSDADLQFQWDLASRIRDKVNEANRAVIRIRRIKTDIAERIKDAPAEVRRRASSWPRRCRRWRKTSTRCGTRAARIRSTSPSRPTTAWHRCCAWRTRAKAGQRATSSRSSTSWSPS